MAQYELVKNTNQNKIKSIVVVILSLILIVALVVLFRSSSKTGKLAIRRMKWLKSTFDSINWTFFFHGQSCLLLHLTSSTQSIDAGPPDGETVICVKFMRSRELLKEFNSIGINKTNAPVAEPDLNSCTHLICTDTYMRITNDVDFIWSNEKRQQYVDCINSRKSYPHLKVI